MISKSISDHPGGVIFANGRLHDAKCRSKKCKGECFKVGASKPGPKPHSPSGEVMKARQIRTTDAQWAKCKRLGGAAWVRSQIEKAKESK